MRGTKADGTIGNIDVLDLDPESFRAFVLDRLVRLEAVAAIREELIREPHLEYRERLPGEPI